MTAVSVPGAAVAAAASIATPGAHRMNVDARVGVSAAAMVAVAMISEHLLDGGSNKSNSRRT